MNRVSRGLAVGALFAGLAGAMAAENSPSAKTAKTPETFAGKSVRHPSVIIAPPSAEVVADAIRAEMDAYTRRLDACTRLRQIALEAGNDALLNETDEIERQAAVLYKARVARFGIRSTESPKPITSDRRLPSAVDPTKVGPPTPGRSAK